MTAALIIIGIAALALACGGIFFFVKKTKTVRKNEEEESDTTSKKKMGENTKPSKPEVKEKPVKVEKTETEKEEIKKKEVTRRIQRLSELGLNRSKDVNVNEVENGTEAIGIVYNEKSKVYMFNPVGNKLNPGDVVTVLDQSDTKRTVPVVLGNTFLADSDIVKPFKDILDIIYQTNETAPAKVVHEEKPVEPVEEVKEETPEVLEEPVIETPKFTVTFDNLGHGESIDPLTDLENMPDALPLLTEEGFEFEGWFMDGSFEHEAEFDVKLENDVTLYAKWNEIPKPIEVVEEVKEETVVEDAPVVVETPKFTVTFDNLGHGENIESLTDLENMPDALPLLTEEGFEFEGWFMDSNFEHEAEFDVKLENDVTLYAKWNEIPKPIEVVEEVTEPEPQEDEPEDDDA